MLKAYHNHERSELLASTDHIYRGVDIFGDLRQGIERGTHGSIKYGPIGVLFFNRELLIADHYLRPQYLNHISIFNSHGESQIAL